MGSMSLAKRARRFFRQNWAPLTRTGQAFAGAAAIALTASVLLAVIPRPNIVLGSVELGELTVIGLLVLVVVLLVVQGFGQRRRFSRIEHRLGIEEWSPHSYAYRAVHFHEEKESLCEDLVRIHLPELVKNLSGKALKGIDVVIDSGTTLAPVFPRLQAYGLLGCQKDIQDQVSIFTNSTAGIDLYNNATYVGRPGISEQRVHLLGGNPLKKYRATTGPDTEQALRDLSERSHRNGRSVIWHRYRQLACRRRAAQGNRNCGERTRSSGLQACDRGRR